MHQKENTTSLFSSHCPLCKAKSEAFSMHSDRLYLRCTNCDSIFLHHEHFPEPEREKTRYELHNDPGKTEGYLDFISPVLNALNEPIPGKNKLLDYGAGPHAFLAGHLEKRDWSVAVYDPFFYPDKIVLENNYDFILLVEVIEHFHRPALEFEHLFSKLKPGGKIICMTDMYTEKINFDTWYYKNDPTHVFFYHQKAIEFLANKHKCSNLKTEGRLIVFTQ